MALGMQYSYCDQDSTPSLPWHVLRPQQSNCPIPLLPSLHAHMQLVAGCDLNPLARGIMTSPAAVMRIKVLLFKVGGPSESRPPSSDTFWEGKQAHLASAGTHAS